MMDFKDRTVIVTGGTRGIGKAVAKAFAGAGAVVVITGRNEEQAKKVASELDGNVHGLALDISNPASVSEFFPAAIELLGGMQVASACSSRSRGDISGSSAQTPASKRTRVGEEPTPLAPSRVPRKGEEDAPSAQNCSRL